jgi:hypothetical protein
MGFLALNKTVVIDKPAKNREPSKKFARCLELNMTIYLLISINYWGGGKIQNSPNFSRQGC